jgi:hypothetical protein
MTPLVPLKLATRAAMMSALKHSAAMTALVPKASIYPGTVPASRTFPFSRFGSMIATPFVASGLNSEDYRIMIQSFTKPLYSVPGDPSSILLQPAEDRAIAISEAVKGALDETTLTLSIGLKLRLSWIQSIQVVDGDEADAWMDTSFFRGEVSG